MDAIPPPTGTATPVTDKHGPVTQAGSTIDTRRKKTSLWSYILPTPSAEPSPANANNINTKNEPTLPATGPADRNAVSIRLMLGDAQAALQQLSDRVDRVLEAKNAEDDRVERALVAVAESNAAHTSHLEAVLDRCSTMEAALAAQTRVIKELDVKCEMHTTNMLNLHNIVTALLPLVPLPSEIQNAHLQTVSAIDRVVEGVLRTSQDHRREFVRISEDHKILLSERVAGAAEVWRDATSAGLDRLRDEFTHGLEAQREAMALALSLHRQEVNGMLSAALSKDPARVGLEKTIRPQSPREDAHSPKLTLPTPRLNTRGASSSLNREANTAQPDRPCGPTNSLANSSFAAARSDDTSAQDAAKNSGTAAVPDKNSINTQVGRVLVTETQSTALSSAPDEEITPSEEESMPLGSGVQHTATTTAVIGRTFGALQRVRSAFEDFTTPDSPPFSVQRQPLITQRGHEAGGYMYLSRMWSIDGIHAVAAATQHTQSKRVLPTHELVPEFGISAWSGTIDPARASTLGRLSPGAYDGLIGNLNKRPLNADGVLQTQGLTKRPRKAKTRTILNSQDLLMLDSSPE